MACLELAETHLGILTSLAIWLLLLLLLVNGQLASLCIAGVASTANTSNSEIVL